MWENVLCVMGVSIWMSLLSRLLKVMGVFLYVLKANRIREGRYEE